MWKLESFFSKISIHAIFPQGAIDPFKQVEDAVRSEFPEIYKELQTIKVMTAVLKGQFN